MFKCFNPKCENVFPLKDYSIELQDHHMNKGGLFCGYQCIQNYINDLSDKHETPKRIDQLEKRVVILEDESYKHKIQNLENTILCHRETLTERYNKIESLEEENKEHLRQRRHFIRLENRMRAELETTKELVGTLRRENEDIRKNIVKEEEKE